MCTTQPRPTLYVPLIHYKKVENSNNPKDKQSVCKYISLLSELINTLLQFRFQSCKSYIANANGDNQQVMYISSWEVNTLRYKL